MKETWKTIKNFPNYKISNYGNIINIRNNKLKKQTLHYTGYLIVNLYNNTKSQTFRVHRLVAAAFILNPHNKRVVNHIDGNKTNNVVTNLEWNTDSENEYHSYRVLNRKPCYKAVDRYDKQGNYIETHENIKNAEIQFKTGSGHISKCCKGKRKTAGGYIWRYHNHNF